MVESNSLAHMPVNDAARFLRALFGPDDLVCFRPIEIWVEELDGQRRKRSRVDYKGCTYASVGQPDVAERVIAVQCARSESEQTNVFFGVAPRFGARKFDEAWQIRRLTALWSDVDNATPEDVIERIAKAGLPPASIVVASGNGAHVYWLLETPYLIDDVCDPPAIKREFLDGRPGEEKKVVRWFHDPVTGERVDLLPGGHTAPPLSPKAILFQDTLAGIAAKIGGDHTTDVSRILRVPGTLNRKHQRNGRQPIPCLLHSLDAELRYSFDQFVAIAESSPSKARREAVAKVPLPRTRKPSPKRQDKLGELILLCDSVAVGGRSEADFSLCCWAIENRISRDLVWADAQSVGKFRERGEDYFRRTWEAAAARTREKTYDRVQQEVKRRADSHDRAASGDRIIMCGPDEHRVADEAIAALATSTTIYQRGQALVQIVRDAKPPKGVKRPPNLPTIAPIAKPRLCKELSERATWMRENGENLVQTAVPERIVAIVEANGQWPGVRPLMGIVECPTLRPDGSILEEPGYDEDTGLIVMLSQAFSQIPASPTRQDALRAVGELIEVWEDFPFESAAHAVAPLAATLTMLIRHAIAGPCPLFSFGANAPGSGKGMLVDSVSIIATGRKASRMAAPETAEEWVKTILSVALSGERLILFDNVDGDFGNKALDAALTATTWSGRLLGHNKFVSGVPLDAVWFVTGNQLEIVGDTSRRVLLARLLCLEERPEERTGFKHLELLEWAEHERLRLVVAGLTILRAWVAAGRPTKKIRPWGSYEAWSALIRQPLVWLGLPDPAEIRSELPTRTANDRADHIALLDGWEHLLAKLGQSEASVADAVHAIDAERNLDSEIRVHDRLCRALETLVGVAPGAALLPKSISQRLRRFEQRVVDGRYLACRDRGKLVAWRICHSQEQGGRSGSSDSFPSLREEGMIFGEGENAHAGI